MLHSMHSLPLKLNYLLLRWWYNRILIFKKLGRATTSFYFLIVATRETNSQWGCIMTWNIWLTMFPFWLKSNTLSLHHTKFIIIHIRLLLYQKVFYANNDLMVLYYKHTQPYSFFIVKGGWLTTLTLSQSNLCVSYFFGYG